MGAQLGGSGSFNDINMTPLIDIVLVVLIIMMVNIPIQVEKMDVKLPSNRVVDTPPTNREQLVIARYDDGRLALNRRVMSKERLLGELSRYVRNSEEKRVFVDAGREVAYGDVVDLVDLAYTAGAGMVGLAKLKDDGPLPATSVDEGGMPRGLYFNSPTVRTDGGRLNEVDADRAIQQVKPALESCYGRRLAERSALTGNQTYIVEVGPDGTQLSAPRLESDGVGDPELADCILEALQQLRYPELGEQKTAAIRYGILFSPG